MSRADLDALIIDLELGLLRKINAADFNTKIAEQTLLLDSLSSNLAFIGSRVSQFDNNRILFKDVEASLDCKITLADYQTKINNSIADLNSLDSNIAAAASKLDLLEYNTSTLL